MRSWIIGQTPWLAAARIDYIDIRFTSCAGIERNRSSVGRPMRTARQSASKGGKLHRVRASAVGYPNLEPTGAVAGECNTPAVRRNPCISLTERGGYQRAEVLPRSGKIEPPHVRVPAGRLGVDQTVALRRKRCRTLHRI